MRSLAGLVARWMTTHRLGDSAASTRRISTVSTVIAALFNRAPHLEEWRENDGAWADCIQRISGCVEGNMVVLSGGLTVYYNRTTQKTAPPCAVEMVFTAPGSQELESIDLYLKGLPGFVDNSETWSTSDYAVITDGRTDFRYKGWDVYCDLRKSIKEIESTD